MEVRLAPEVQSKVEKGLASVERGEFQTHEEVGARLEKRIAEKQSR